MFREDMRCHTCIKFHEETSSCRCKPVSVPIHDPESYWCGEGQWGEWSERYQEMEPFYWGEGEEKEQDG